MYNLYLGQVSTTYNRLTTKETPKASDSPKWFISNDLPALQCILCKVRAFCKSLCFQVVRNFFCLYLLGVFIPSAYAVSPLVDLSLISFIESSDNPKAFNKHSGCIGLYQINPKGALADYNQMKRSVVLASDLYDPSVNRMVAEWYLSERIPSLLRHFKKEVNLKNVLWAYNCGIGCVTKGRLPDETKRYIEKYEALALVR